MSAFAGTFQQSETKNVDAYLDALGVPEEMRATVKDTENTVQVTIEGDTWTYLSTMGGKQNTIVLKLGTMTDYTTPLGVPMKGILKSVGEKVVEEHFMGDVKVDCVREIVNGKLCSSMTAKGVTAEIWYVRK